MSSSTLWRARRSTNASGEWLEWPMVDTGYCVDPNGVSQLGLMMAAMIL